MLFSASGRLAPRAFWGAVLSVYLLGFASQALLAAPTLVAAWFAWERRARLRALDPRPSQTAISREPTASTARADRTGLPPLTRFAEGVAVALERGTPLAEVLRAQAQDVRESGRRALMEAGGKKEVAMLVPVVFLVLPVTVVFAVFPSFATLRIGL